jgi:hypothetical protein
MSEVKRYPCYNDQYVSSNQVLEHAIDQIKLAQLHNNKKVSVALAISHLMNWLERESV